MQLKFRNSSRQRHLLRLDVAKKHDGRTKWQKRNKQARFHLSFATRHLNQNEILNIFGNSARALAAIIKKI